MSWITELRSRDLTSAGSVEVNTPGSDDPIVIPLRYPDGGDKIMVTEILEKMSPGGGSVKPNRNAPSPKLSTILRLSDEASLAMVRACIDTKGVAEGDEPTDKEIMILIRESGGEKGELIKRCAKLMGINALARDEDDKEG